MLAYAGIMNIQLTNIHRSRRSDVRLHVLPDTKDRIFSKDEQETFQKSAANYFSSYDQAGRTGAARGSRDGVLISGVLGIAVASAATLSNYGSFGGMVAGAVIGTTIAGVLGVIIYPAVVDNGRARAEDKFADAHPAPYLEVKDHQWLTADGHRITDWNRQTDGRLG